MGTLCHHLSGLIFLAGLLNHQQYVIISLKMALLAKSYHFTNLDFPQDSRGPISQPPNAVSNYISIVRQKIKQLHPRKLTCPLERDYFNRKLIFQPIDFQGTCSFSGEYMDGLGTIHTLVERILLLKSRATKACSFQERLLKFSQEKTRILSHELSWLFNRDLL